MPTICIQCGLERVVRGVGTPDKLPELAKLDEDPDTHMRRAHPDGINPSDIWALEAKVANINAQLDDR